MIPQTRSYVSFKPCRGGLACRKFDIHLHLQRTLISLAKIVESLHVGVKSVCPCCKYFVESAHMPRYFWHPRPRQRQICASLTEDSGTTNISARMHLAQMIYLCYLKIYEPH